MYSLVKAMFSVIGAWVGLSFLFISLGLLVRRAYGMRIHSRRTLLTCFWMGWTIAIILLQLWHFWLPINSHILLILVGISVLGLLWNWKDLWSLAARWTAKDSWACFVVAILTIWISNQAIRPPSTYDSGLYYIPLLRWFKTYPIVPGLGNLHGRLAFNSSHFLYVAMLDTGPWLHKSSHIANGLLLIALFVQVIPSCFTILQYKRINEPYHIFNILLLGTIFRQARGHFISSPSPDLVVFCLGIVLSSQLLFLLDNVRSTEEKNYILLVITVIAALGLTIKLSFAAFGGVAALLALTVRCIQVHKLQEHGIKKTIIWISAIVAMILLPWMIRGVILSGYIAYPLTIGTIPVEWRVPRALVIDEANWIRSWARAPHTDWHSVLSNWNWFKPWLRIMLSAQFDVVIPLILTFVAVFLTLIVKRVLKKTQHSMRTMLWVSLLPAIISLLFWFVTAPDLRFAGASFWILGASSVILALNSLTQVSCLSSLKTTSLSLGILGLSLALAIISFRYYAPSPLINKPGEANGFHSVSQAKLETFVTDYGLVLYVPDGEQCWWGKLPCTPYPKDNLRLRYAGDMRYGFELVLGD